VYAYAVVAPPDSLVPPTLADFTLAAKVARPSAVHIKTYSRDAEGQQDAMEEFLHKFYGTPIPQEQSTPGQEKDPQLSGSGSGVIISSDGFIITSNHIVANSDKIEVILNDRRSYIATVVGTDPSTDVALLKIDAEALPAIEYGNSDDIKVGEWVLAVGNPFNLTSTVTAGIVSAKGRNINILGGESNRAIESFIQTDAAVNPGNSGGALVNLYGKLIGINTAIASPTGSYAGYSFAVPVNIVKKVVSDLLEYGKVQRGMLGVMIRELNAELAKEKGIKSLQGVYIEEVVKNSAAEASGLQGGDVITSTAGVEVNTPAQLQEVIALHKPGDKLNIKFRRKDKEKETTAILLGKVGGTEMMRFDPTSVESLIGATLKEPDALELKKLNIKGGVQVQNLKPGKFKGAGVTDGFIITHIDTEKVNSVKDVKAILNQDREGGILIEGMYPDGRKAFYAISLNKNPKEGATSKK